MSYYQASLICRLHRGEVRISAPSRRCCCFTRQGKTRREVFKEALGRQLDDFDTQFLRMGGRQSEEHRLESLHRSWCVQGQTKRWRRATPTRRSKSFKSAIEMYPEYTDEHNAYEPLADAYLKKGDKKAAIDTLKKFMTYSETSFKASLKLAELLTGSRRHGRSAAKRWKAPCTSVRWIWKGTRSSADLLISQKQYAPAAREYEALLALNTPDKAGAYYKLAEANFGQGNGGSCAKNVLKSSGDRAIIRAGPGIVIKN